MRFGFYGIDYDRWSIGRLLLCMLVVPLVALRSSKQARHIKIEMRVAGRVRLRAVLLEVTSILLLSNNGTPIMCSNNHLRWYSIYGIYS
jgi:hypothetical protein